MVNQELEIVEVLEGSTFIPDWMVEQDREVLTFSLVSALTSWTGSSCSPAASRGREAEVLSWSGAGAGRYWLPCD